MIRRTWHVIAQQSKVLMHIRDSTYAANDRVISEFTRTMASTSVIERVLGALKSNDEKLLRQIFNDFKTLTAHVLSSLKIIKAKPKSDFSLTPQEQVLYPFNRESA